MKSFIALSFAALFLTNGCVSLGNAPKPPQVTPPKRVYEKPTPQKEAIFQKEMIRVALSTKEDPNYRKLALDTAEKKQWFKELLYRLWDRQITRSEFIAQGLKRYPDREYEFTFIANGFQHGC